MLIVLGHEIDFDVTSPADMQRYLDAQAALDAATKSAAPIPAADMATCEGLEVYTAYIRGQCKLLTDFLDAAFGDGTCNTLLGPKTSLSALMDVMDALRDAITAQGEQYAQRLGAYAPNRAIRHGAAK